MTGLTAQQLLSSEFEKRKNKNPAYSLRAFSRDLGISKTSLGDVINGHRRLSLQNLIVLGNKLSLTEGQMAALKEESFSEPQRELLGGDELSLVEDWHYLAILNLAKLKNAHYCAEWISERLGISHQVASSALEELQARGHIENRDGTLIRKTKPLTTTTNIPSASIVEHHRQSIEKALIALEDVSVEFRDFTAVTYAIDLKKIDEAKECILSFHRKLGKLLESDEANEVYRLNIQFFPLTKITQN